MRLAVALPLTLLLSACQGPSAIQTSARGSLRGEVEEEIREAQRMHHDDCPVAKIVAARIETQGSGATQEVWTLEGCGRTFLYDVTVTHEDFGGGQVSVHERDVEAQR